MLQSERRRRSEGGAERCEDADLLAWKQIPAEGCKNIALEAGKARKRIVF